MRKRKGEGQQSTGTPKRGLRGRIGCALVLWLLAMGAGFALNEVGVIHLPFPPRVLGLVKKVPAQPGAEEAEQAGSTEEETAEAGAEPEDAATEDEGGAEKATPAAGSTTDARSSAAPADRAPAAAVSAPEQKATKEAQQRLQRVADIVGELSPEAAVETLSKMPIEEQISIVRLLDDKGVSKILEGMDTDARVEVLQGLAQAPGARLLPPSEVEEAPEKGETARRSLLSLPFRRSRGAE